MDNGKENRFFIIKNENKFAQGKKGGIRPLFEGVRDRDRIDNRSQILHIPFDAKRAVDGDNALNGMSTAVENVDQESLALFSRMGDGEKGNSKLSRGSNANEKNLVHVGNGISGTEMASLSLMKNRKEEEEEEALSSSCATSHASTLSGKWSTDDEVDSVQSESQKVGLRKWLPSLFPSTTWMDQVSRSSQQDAGLSIDSPLSYESHGTGEEGEVVEGEVSNIDDEDDEAEHPDVSMDSGQESGEEKELASQPSAKKRNVEELERSLEERERKVDKEIKKLLSEWSAHRTFTVRRKDKLLTIFWDGGKRQWLISDGVRCRKHNKIWDPPIPTDGPTTVPAESGAAEEEDEVGEAINIDDEDDEVEEEEEEEEEDMESDDDMRKLEALISGTREISVRLRSLGKRKEDESGSRTIGVLEKRARKAESSKRQPDGFGSLFTTRA